jgi:YD repeat-containing protein
MPGPFHGQGGTGEPRVSRFRRGALASLRSTGWARVEVEFDGASRVTSETCQTLGPKTSVMAGRQHHGPGGERDREQWDSRSTRGADSGRGVEN